MRTSLNMFETYKLYNGIQWHNMPVYGIPGFWSSGMAAAEGIILLTVMMA